MAEKKRMVKQTAKGNNVTQIAGDLNVTVTEDVQAVFDEAAQLINTGKAQTAQVLLERLWRCHNDTMRSQQKSNCRRLIGCTLERQDKCEEAGRCFIEATELDPTWEKARAFEAVGYFCLGNSEKAHSLADAVVREFSQNTIAWSIWIRTAPDGVSLGEIQAHVPAHLQKDAEVCMALAIAAMARGDYDKAEELAATTQELLPGNPRAIERLADLLFARGAIHDQVAHGRMASDRERACLARALELYSSALKKWSVEGSNSGIIRVRLARAWVYVALLEREKAKQDVNAAYELAPDDATVAYSYAALVGGENIDAGIEALRKVVGKDDKPGVEHLLAQMLFKRNRDSDRNDAIGLLKRRIKDLYVIPESARYEYMNSLIEMETELADVECALATIKDMQEGVLGGRVQAILQSKALWLGEKREEALRIAKDMYDTLDRSVTFDEKRELASLLQVMGMHREALCVWKSIVRTDCISADVYKMIDCAKHCGAENEVLQLAAGLRQNRVWDKNIFEYEMFLRQKYNDWRECKRILQDYITSPLDTGYLPYARAHLSHVSAVLNEPSLIETDVSRLPLPQDIPVEMGRLVVQALRVAGEPRKAVDYAYELLRANYTAIDAHLAMANFMIPIGPKQLPRDLPKVVGPGTAVQYKEDRANAPVWHIIEDSNIGRSDESRNEYSVDHLYSQKMLGLKKGDSFLLRAGGIQERKAVIVEIVSKYDFRIVDCIHSFEERFPDNPIIIKINAYREDGQIDLDPMRRLADIGEARGKQSLQSYKEHCLPIYSLAAMMGRDLCTTLGHLIGLPDTEIYCRRGHPSEVQAAVRRLEDAKEIVLDEIALATLVLCDAHEHLTRIPKTLIVSLGTLLSIEQWEVTGIDPDNPGMIAGNIDGKLAFVPRAKEEVESIQARIRTLTQFIREHCVVESGVPLSFFDTSQRDLFSKVLGEACAETIAIARVGRRVLWTDDLTCAALYTQGLGGARVWTELIFDYLGRQGLMDPVTVRLLILRLVSFRYWFTSVNGEMAVQALKEADWDSSRSPLKEVIRHFGDPRVNLDANLIRMIARLLKFCWDEDSLGLKASGITMRVLNELAKRRETHISVLVRALWVLLERMFGLNVLTARQVKEVFQDWLAGRAGGLVLL
jgi:tetratricopeptide (TPR) repeat protein